MPTPAQIFANKLNAKRSTGPRTLEGKARSSINSLKHGLCAETTVLPHEDPEEYEHLREIIHRDFAAQSEFEVLHLDLVARAYWRLIRSSRVECGMFTKRLVALADHEQAQHEEMDFDQGISVCYLHFAKEFDLHRRYETAIERSYYKALDAIKRLRGTISELTESSGPSESAIPLAVAAGSAAQVVMESAPVPYEVVSESASVPGEDPAACTPVTDTNSVAVPPSDRVFSPAPAMAETTAQVQQPVTKNSTGFVSNESAADSDHRAGVTSQPILKPPFDDRSDRMKAANTPRCLHSLN